MIVAVTGLLIVDASRPIKDKKVGYKMNDKGEIYEDYKHRRI
jgi:hypothetical protein